MSSFKASSTVTGAAASASSSHHTGSGSCANCPDDFQLRTIVIAMIFGIPALIAVIGVSALCLGYCVRQASRQRQQNSEPNGPRTKHRTASHARWTGESAPYCLYCRCHFVFADDLFQGMRNSLPTSDARYVSVPRAVKPTRRNERGQTGVSHDIAPPAYNTLSGSRRQSHETLPPAYLP